MNASVQTVWAKTGTPSAKRKTARRVHNPVDPSALSVCSDPLPAHRMRPDCKYLAVFNQLKPGLAVKCPTDDANRIANALRKHIEAHPKELGGCTVRSTGDYGDGAGRVWLVAPEVPATKIQPLSRARAVAK